jgi:hypothetical protein
MSAAPFVAVWLLLPCDSPVTTDHVARVTTVQSCPQTFGEAAGPFLAKGWRPPQGASASVAPPTKAVVPAKKKVTSKKVKKSSKRRKKR